MSKYWRILGSVALVAFLAWNLDWAGFARTVSVFDLRFGLYALLVYLAAQVVSSVRWQMLAGPLGFDRPFRQYLSLYFVGMFFNQFLPGAVGGDFVRAWYLGQTKEKFPRAFLSVVAERGSGLAILVCLACVGGVFLPAEAPQWMRWICAGLTAGLVLGVASLPFMRYLERLPYVGRKLSQPVEAVQTYLARPGLLAVVLSLSVVVQLASVGQVWLLARGLGLDVSYGWLLVAVPLLTLLTLLPISVNGVGLREVGLLVLLAPVGVDKASAVTLSLVQFFVCLLTGLAGGVLYMAGAYPRLPATSGAKDGPAAPSEDGDEALGRDPHQGRAGQSSAAA